MFTSSPRANFHPWYRGEWFPPACRLSQFPQPRRRKKSMQLKTILNVVVSKRQTTALKVPVWRSSWRAAPRAPLSPWCSRRDSVCKHICRWVMFSPKCSLTFYQNRTHLINWIKKMWLVRAKKWAHPFKFWTNRQTQWYKEVNYV